MKENVPRPGADVVSPDTAALTARLQVLSSWYSGCPVCSGSRAALMTGRQYVNPRTSELLSLPTRLCPPMPR